MRKVAFALLFLGLPALYWALPGVSALAQRYLNERELEAVRTAGQAYWEVFANQRPDQALCSLHRNRLPPEALGEFLAEQRALVRYPEDGRLMGDWRKGGEIFNDIRRANCFSCHFGSPVHLGGDVGPSLEKYGGRGLDEAVQRYTYEVIYNAWAFFPCSVMYRFGVQGLLTPEVSAWLEGRLAPHREHLFEPLVLSESLLYKRDTFYSTWDELAGQAVQALYPEVELVFSPAVRWGTTVLPGEALTRNHLYTHLGFTYPELYLFWLRGEQVLGVLEDIAGNVFTPDPFYQQGGDVSRVYGLRYALDPDASTGRRVREAEVGGKPLDPNRRYLVAAYGGRLQRVGEAKAGYEPKPIYEVLEAYLKGVGRVRVDPNPNLRVLGRNYRVPEV